MSWEVEVLPATIGGCLLLVGIVGFIGVRRHRQAAKKNPQFGTVTKTHKIDAYLQSVKVQPNSCDSSPISLDCDSEFEFPENCGLSRSGSGKVTTLNSRHSIPTYDSSRELQVWKVTLKVDRRMDRVVLTIFQAKLYPLKLLDGDTHIFFQIQLGKETKSTQHYLNTGSPSLDETIIFEVSNDNLVDWSMQISLYEIDPYRTRICHGHTTVDLALTSCDQPVYLERDMISNSLGKGIAEVLVTLKYTPQTGKLKLRIVSARNLRRSEFNRFKSFNLVIKVIVGCQIVKRKCVGLPHILDGVIDEGYSFRIPCKVIETCCLQLSLIGWNGLQSDDHSVMGRVTIGPAIYASGSGMEHWRMMMANTNNISEIWHEILPTVER